MPPEQSSKRKKRRRKGEGNGSIHWRTITRNGKDYRQAYYHWREGAQKRSRYIPAALLGLVQEAEAAKRPVVEVLELLGVSPIPNQLSVLEDKSINPSKEGEQAVLEDKSINPSKGLGTGELSSSKNSPSKRRDRGEGSGCIYWRTLTKNGKDYQQAYYQYEFWEKGDRLIKSSKYIPKGKLAQVQRLEEQKAPVREILKLLGVVK